MRERIQNRTRLVYGGLCLLWLVVLVWQTLEHQRVRHVSHAELANRARDISSTLGLVIRSQRRFGGFISKDRIESALNSLIRPGEINTIALLNDAGSVVASAGPVDFDLKELVPSAESWGPTSVALLTPVDLGTNLTSDADVRNATIVIPRGEMPPPFGTNRPPPGPPGPPPDGDEGPSLPPPEADTNAVPAGFAPGTESSSNPTNAVVRGRGRPRRGDPRSPFGRPFWMSEEEYRNLLQKQGVHSFVLVLTTRSMQAVCRQDLWGRSVISLFASLAVVGLALAWRNLLRSSELEVRLVRASELNARLKEMNLAAAGLAHETRNPLNIIRGLAQMVSRRDGADDETRRKSAEIVNEADRVTAQLNEFINYSRPREVRRASIVLESAVAEVARALSYDLEEKSVQLAILPGLPSIEADEQLLRQALFNLLLNAVQAVDHGGHIEVAAVRTGPATTSLEIRDDGPGVPAEHRTEIFRPYFTTHQKGTGLGLAVVQQIVLAHGWEIECLPREPRGAVFRLAHLRLATAA